MKEGRGNMENKRGLSTVIVTVILIGLSLAAVVIVWAVVNGLLKQGAGNIDVGSKCLGITVEATYANCSDPSACSVTLQRTGTGSDEIGGVKLVFKNSTTTSSVIDVPGNIAALEGKQTTVNSTLTAPISFGVTAYFKDTSGKESLCQQTNNFQL